MAQKVERREKLAQKVGRREIYSPVPPPHSHNFIMPFSLMKWLLTEEEFCLGRSRKRFWKHFTLLVLHEAFLVREKREKVLSF